MPSQQRTSSDEARLQLVKTGVRLLSERGLRLDPLGIEFTEVIAATDVPRSSAYRAFKQDDMTAQQAFSEALAESLIESNTHGDATSTLEAALAVVSERPNLFEEGTSEELAWTLRELIRVSADANLDSLRESQMVWLYLGTLIAVGQSENPTDHPLAGTLRDPDRVEAMVEFYRNMLESFGLRIRPGWSYERFDAAISATILGYASRMIIDPLLEEIMRPTGPQGEMVPWSMAAMAIEGLVMVAAEPSPRVRNAADLRTWLD